VNTTTTVPPEQYLASSAGGEATLHVVPAPTLPQRHHWVNTLTGVIDSAFSLSGEEQYFVASIIGRLLDQLNVPDRGAPTALPAAVSLEVHAGFYTTQLDARSDGSGRGPRRSAPGEVCVAVEDWRDALVGLLCTAYPELAPTERLLLTKHFDDLLVALGLPDRGATHLPSDVVNAYRDAR
jgi:hypothetical protein